MRYQSAVDLRADLKRLKRATDESVTPSSTATSAAATSASPPSSSDAALAVRLVQRHPIAIIGVTLLLVASAGAVWWALGRDTSPATEPPNISLEALTIDGNAGHATISPDGRFIAYVRRDLTHASVVVKQLGSNSDVVIMPPSGEANYYSPSVTPDGNYVDVLVDARRNPEDPRYIVRVPFLGGTPRRVVERASSGLGWSPDGRRMAYVRWDATTRTTSLIVADADGQNERVLVACELPRQFVSSLHGGARFGYAPAARPAWSPEGRTIAVVRLDRQSERIELIEVDAATGAERSVRQLQDFGGEVAYLSADAIVASEHPTKTPSGLRLWRLYQGTNAGVQLTPDLTDVYGIQLTATRAAGVATKTTTRNAISVGPITGGTLSEAVPASAAEPAFAELMRPDICSTLRGSRVISQHFEARAPVALARSSPRTRYAAADARRPVRRGHPTKRRPRTRQRRWRGGSGSAEGQSSGLSGRDHAGRYGRALYINRLRSTAAMASPVDGR